MQNQLDCEESLLVEDGDNYQRDTDYFLPISYSTADSHQYYERLHNAVWIYAESLQQIARLADWARATRTQSGLLWPEVGITVVCVTNLEEKTFRFSDNNA